MERLIRMNLRSASMSSDCGRLIRLNWFLSQSFKSFYFFFHTVQVSKVVCSVWVLECLFVSCKGEVHGNVSFSIFHFIVRSLLNKWMNGFDHFEESIGINISAVWVKFIQKIVMKPKQNVHHNRRLSPILFASQEIDLQKRLFFKRFLSLWLFALFY